jgi:hypothetical protein
MDQYLNNTRECAFNELNRTLIQAIRSHTEKYGISEVIDQEPVFCIETTSVLMKKGLFGSKTNTTICGVLLLPKWLIVASILDEGDPGVISARIGEITAQDYEDSASYKLIPNSGLDIFGIHPNAADGAGSIFIPLGSETTAQKFRVLIKDLISNAL